MAYVRDLRLFDGIIIFIFVFIVGFLALRSKSPVEVMTHAVPAGTFLLEDAEVLYEGDPLAPDIAVDELLDIEALPEGEDEGVWE